MDHVSNIRKFAENEFYKYDSTRRGVRNIIFDKNIYFY